MVSFNRSKSRSRNKSTVMIDSLPEFMDFTNDPLLIVKNRFYDFFVGTGPNSVQYILFAWKFAWSSLDNVFTTLLMCQWNLKQGTNRIVRDFTSITLPIELPPILNVHEAGELPLGYSVSYKLFSGNSEWGSYCTAIFKLLFSH